MLNIFADALLIATRFGQPTTREEAARRLRRSPQEFQDWDMLSRTPFTRGPGA